MTRIVTIASGLPEAGKTHLAVNLALELVRTGRITGVIYEEGGQLPPDRLLELPPRHAMHDPDNDSPVLRRGYQGIDLVTSRVPLSRWGSVDRARRAALVRAYESLADYDDLLIDTSGMTPHAVVTCCRLSPIVLLIVTPDPGALAAVYALLKVLQLNGCESRVLLVANRVESDSQAHDLQVELSVKTMQYLGSEIPLLGALSRDSHVVQAQRARQAVSSLYPDSRIADELFRLADRLDAVPLGSSAHPASVSAFWSGYADSLETPLLVAGGVRLTDTTPAPRVPESGSPEEQEEPAAATSLLRFEGPLSRLDQVMQGFSSVMHVVANDMLLLHEHLADLETVPQRPEDWTVVDSTALELMLARVLGKLLQELDESQPVCFQVEENPVNGRDEHWLCAGHYLKYIILVPGPPRVIEAIRRELELLPGLRNSVGQEGECICEALSTTRDACLSVINTPQGELRVHYWHPSGSRVRLPAVRQEAEDIPPARAHDRHPAHKRLH